jgi:hypothetical protein
MYRYKSARGANLSTAVSEHSTPQPIPIKQVVNMVSTEKHLEEPKCDKPYATNLNAKWETVEYSTSEDPNFWGPALWFSLHNGAAGYPEEATKICASKMKGFIIGLPYILPCGKCADHSRAYIDSKMHKLDEICSSRALLFDFFVDLHNSVNERYGKPYMSSENAMNLYKGRATLSRFTY